MKKWTVNLPITGVICVNEVEANTEEEAIEKALDMSLTSDMITEWDAVKQVVRGNVLMGTINNAEAIEEDPEEEE